ncbi:MAG: response regulator transcription factor [Betaproteobacteria bacterium]|nr:response regulator transcription factor [Betaproteobacteria bacterium]
MKVLVVDDHTLIREALRNVLAELDPACEVLDAPDGAMALRLAGKHPGLDLVLLDLNLPDMDGFAVLADLRQRYPATGVVVLSGVKDQKSVTGAIELGAVGYIPKSTPHEVMVSALRLVCAGGVYLPPEVLAGAHRASRSAGEPQLTEREGEVLALMLEGKSNKLICRKLGVTEATVKNHVTAILKALNVTNRTEAVIAAGRLGWKPKVS